ncbi:MAG: Asp-tRNA(Asn)/Glu-tRNA(Gln) amidotransferase subunit GatA [Desulfobacteraceae bacterium]|nr:MAG: Asp-tRNA(Asn)/Glu-tRNA(Gln) amidotransferase subunit GatA [Desulfobacteraceae bacterium]
MELYALTLHQASALLKKREISSRELTRAVLDRIDAKEPGIGAYIHVAGKSAMKEADVADRAISEGRSSPLTGIPIAVKDLMCTRGLPTTCGSKILENFVPPFDATVIEKLKTAGAVIVGKTNMDEFAMGSSTENSGFKLTRNPWNADHIPGGSSGGSAAAVAADMCAGALGSDTGGSIRQPASHCGIVGLKPTYGRVSRFGLVSYASSLDQIGPMTKDVTDSALLLNAISGYDPKDSTSVPMEVPDYTKALSEGLDGVKIGIPGEYLETEGLDFEVSAAVKAALTQLESAGAECVEVSLPHSGFVVATYYIIAPSEASSNLARYDGVRYGFRHGKNRNYLEMYRSTRSKGFGPEVRRRIILGTYALSAGYYDAYYGKASQVRTRIVEDFKEAFKKCDVIAAPVAPTPAFRIGEKTDDPLMMYLSDIFTLSANLAGIPGMSVPCGFSSDGLPVGLQLLSSHFNEGLLLKTAYNFERNTAFHLKKPSI